MSLRSIAVLVGLALMVPAVAVAEPQTEPDVLPAPAGGEQAIAALGADLAVAAQRNGISVAEFKRRLADESVYADRSGRLLVKDTALPPAPSAASVEPAAEVASGPYPNSQTFLLHSKPGSERVIYLDFNGATVSGTGWNSQHGLPDAAYEGFDTNGSPSTWSQSEHNIIQNVFQRVSEDYAAFDVDVTTEDPGTEAIERSSRSDTRYGTVALVSGSDSALSLLCRDYCGGIAYVGVFNQIGHSWAEPAWVFSRKMYNDPKNIAEGISHEVGHNLGLVHDGTSSAAYYEGSGGWAPIMGAGYYEPVTQFSKGEYPGANNQQDDLADIRSHGLSRRVDEAGSTISGATPLGTATTSSAVITSDRDADVFSISRNCSKSTTIKAVGAQISPNLDISLRLLDASGRVLRSSNMPFSQLNWDKAVGLGASVTKTLSPGTYYVEVTGVGSDTQPNGYSAYGSIGQYTLSITGC